MDVWDWQHFFSGCQYVGVLRGKREAVAPFPSITSTSTWPPPDCPDDTPKHVNVVSYSWGRWSVCLFNSCDSVRLLLVRQAGSAFLLLLFPSCQLWSGPWCFLDGVGWKWGAGKREGICAYHTSLSSHWQESACSSVGECTCIQSAEERRTERKPWCDGGRQRGREEMNACQASSLGEVLVVHCSKHCLISLFVCACTCVMSMLCFPAGSGGLIYDFAGLKLNFFWFHSLHQSPFNKICCWKHLHRITEYLKKLNSANSCIFFSCFQYNPSDILQKRSRNWLFSNCR